MLHLLITLPLHIHAVRPIPEDARPCCGLYCCLFTCLDFVTELKSPQPVFMIIDKCVCFCIQSESFGECRPRAPWNETMCDSKTDCKCIDPYHTGISMDHWVCCCDYRCSLMPIDEMFPFNAGLCFYTFLWEKKKTMTFFKTWKELNEFVPEIQNGPGTQLMGNSYGGLTH